MGLLARTFDRQKACFNMVTGYVPVGAACTSSDECARAGEFAQCYNGSVNPGAPGLCAKVVLDDSACSFSFDDATLRVCSAGKFCDLSGFKPRASDPPELRMLVFSGICRDEIAAGGSCINPANTAGILACQQGLFCDVEGASTATCVAQKKSGAACKINTVQECADGLTCTPHGAGMTCQRLGPPGHLYCVAPATCGDQTCDPGETATSCPEDCTITTCGDGVCDANEAPFCPADCCGDGLCQPGEMGTCPQDCGA